MALDADRRPTEQILTVAQMQAAEAALIESGTSVDTLMQRAGQGAGEYVRRIAAGRRVTVLCGPGNNGGDGYVIAEHLREHGDPVAVVAVREPATDAARNAAAGYQGAVYGSDAAPRGEVLVDCLFGTGLTRPLPDDLAALLARLAASHAIRIAVDLPSGIHSDRGVALNDGLPSWDLTIALGAWKFAHWTLPASLACGTLRLVDIGVGPFPDAARTLERPRLAAPAPDAHKYRRGLVAVVGGAMPGAAVLACEAALRGGAGYVRLLAAPGAAHAVPVELVEDRRPLAQALEDGRIAVALVGPGLGRDSSAEARLTTALDHPRPMVLDADALVLLRPGMIAPGTPTVLTPHEGELAALERAFGLSAEGLRRERALALALATGAVVLLKGPDSLIAAPDGRLACAARAPSWLSVAGSGDVLAGIVAARLAVTRDPFQAACEGLWLHGEAARHAAPAFTAGELARHVADAIAAALA